MLSFVVFFHTVICLLLLIAILMQSGRGGGLTEGFAPAESILGAKTNSFMVKTTTVLCIVFFVTCTGLALMSSKKARSIMPAQVAMPKSELPSEGQSAAPETAEEAKELVDEVLGIEPGTEEPSK